MTNVTAYFTDGSGYDNNGVVYHPRRKTSKGVLMNGWGVWHSGDDDDYNIYYIRGNFINGILDGDIYFTIHHSHFGDMRTSYHYWGPYKNGERNGRIEERLEHKNERDPTYQDTTVRYDEYANDIRDGAALDRQSFYFWKDGDYIGYENVFGYSERIHYANKTTLFCIFDQDDDYNHVIEIRYWDPSNIGCYTTKILRRMDTIGTIFFNNKIYKLDGSVVAST